MQYNITGRNIDLTDPIKDYVKAKLVDTLEPLLREGSASLRVELSVANDKKHSHTCHAAVSWPQDQHVNITESDDDLYQAIDKAHHRLLEQVKRHRDKLGKIDHRTPRHAS